MSLRLVIAGFSTLLLLGCQTDEPRLSFRGDPPASGPGLSLRAAGLDDRQLTLEVVGHELDDLYGVAFRVAYDASALEFITLEPGAAFEATPSLLVAAREKKAGLLFGAVTYQGRQPGVAAHDESVATLHYKLVDHTPTRIELVQSRSSAVKADGHPIELRVASGELVLD